MNVTVRIAAGIHTGALVSDPPTSPVPSLVASGRRGAPGGGWACVGPRAYPLPCATGAFRSAGPRAYSKQRSDGQPDGGGEQTGRRRQPAPARQVHRRGPPHCRR